MGDIARAIRCAAKVFLVVAAASAVVPVAYVVYFVYHYTGATVVRQGDVAELVLLYWGTTATCLAFSFLARYYASKIERGDY